MTTEKKITEELKHLERLESAIGSSSELKLHTFQIFLLAARADIAGEPMDGRQLSEATGLAGSSISRNLSIIGDWDYKQTKGLGLVSMKPELSNRRRKPVRLTAKGKRVLALMTEG